jgi:GGDEF domain-containing protein
VTIAIGGALFVVADVVYDRPVQAGHYSGGDPVDILYVLAVPAFALGAASQRQVVAASRGAAALRPRHIAVVPYLALGAVFGLLVATQWHDEFFPDLSLVLAAAAVAAVIALRQVVAQRELVGLHAELRAAHRELADLAATDPLTALPNQRALAATIDAELARRPRIGRPCSLSSSTSTTSRRSTTPSATPPGDSTLREFGEVVADELRAVNAFGRWGGEEFVALLPGVDAREAALVAERIRAAVAAHRFGAGPTPLTVSIGVASGLRSGREELLAAADTALYAAKRGGRDRVELGAPRGEADLRLVRG